MKRFIWTCAIIALITSCKTQQCMVHDAQCTVIRDTVMQHDSIYVHEFTQGDTVYVTKYRDRWRDKVVNRTDTVYVLQAQPVLQRATRTVFQRSGRSSTKTAPSASGYYFSC